VAPIASEPWFFSRWKTKPQTAPNLLRYLLCRYREKKRLRAHRYQVCMETRNEKHRTTPSLHTVVTITRHGQIRRGNEERRRYRSHYLLPDYNCWILLWGRFQGPLRFPLESELCTGFIIGPLNAGDQVPVYGIVGQQRYQWKKEHRALVSPRPP